MRTTYTGQLFLMSFYFTVLHTIPAPVNLTILSNNFQHILQWSPGINSPPETLFNVNYSCNGSPQPLLRNITHTTADVSETLKDIFNRCTFLLWASIANMTSSIVSKSITPFEDTVIGPPVIFLSGCGHCLNINISLPNESREDLHRFYASVSFRISWKKAGQKEASYFSTSYKQPALENLQAGNQYCVKVLPQVSSNLNTLASAWQCEYTSKKDPKEGFYMVSRILGVTVPGVVVLLLVLGLVYTGYISKPRIPLPKTLCTIPEAYCLIPEQTLFESVSLTESQLISASKNHLAKNSSPLDAERDPESKGNEEEEYYINKADTEDEDEEEDEHNCNYMDCGWETNREKAIVPVLTLHNNSGIYHTKGEAKEQIHPDTFACRNQFVLDMSEDGGRQYSESETNSAADVCNINLCSVTLRGLGPDEDLDHEEACKPLLAKLVGNEVLDLQEREDRNKPRICTAILTEMKTDDPMAVERQDLRLLCSSDLDMRTEHDTASGSEETDYLSR